MPGPVATPQDVINSICGAAMLRKYDVCRARLLKASQRSPIELADIVNRRAANGETLIHCLVQPLPDTARGVVPFDRVKQQNLLVAILKYPGVEPTPLDQAGFGPLVQAVKHNNLELVKILVDNGSKWATPASNPITVEEFIKNRKPLPQNVQSYQDAAPQILRMIYDARAAVDPVADAADQALAEIKYKPVRSVCVFKY